MAALSVALGWVVAGRVLRTVADDHGQDQADLRAEPARAPRAPGPRDELRELADTIDGLLARLEAAFDAQRRFVANASHELRTPLAMMRTRLDVAVAKPDGVPLQTQALDAGLRKDLARAEALLESFLVLARAQHGALTDPTIVSLDQLVIDAITTRHAQIAEKQLEVRTALAGVDVAGSEMLLARMVENVIENSVRHNLRQGFIDVACENTGARHGWSSRAADPFLTSTASRSSPSPSSASAPSAPARRTVTGLAYRSSRRSPTRTAERSSSTPAPKAACACRSPCRPPHQHPPPGRQDESPGRRGRARIRGPDRRGPARPRHGRRRRLRRPRRRRPSSTSTPTTSLSWTATSPACTATPSAARSPAHHDPR